MNKYWIWFSRINKIGAKTQYELLKKYKTPEKIWGLGKTELEETITKEQIKIVGISVICMSVFVVIMMFRIVEKNKV